MSEKKPMSEARKRANKKWNDANMRTKYDRIQLIVPKGQKTAIEAHAKRKGKSINGYVNALIQADMGITDGKWKGGAKEEGAEE